MKPSKWLCSALLCGSSLALAAVPERTLTFTLPNKPLPVLEWQKPLETTALRGYYGWGETPDAVAIKAQSLDGKCKAATHEAGSVRLECTGASSRILAVHKNLIVRLTFSPDSHFLVTGTYGGSLKWIDVQSGTILHDFHDPAVKSRYRLGHAGQLRALLFSTGDSTTLFTFAHDGLLKRWNTETGQLEGIVYGVNDLQPAQDGQNLWLSRPTAMQQVRSSDFSTLKRLEGMSGPFKLSKDEKYAQIQDKFVLNLETGKLLNDSPALAWAVSPDDKTVAAHRGHKVNIYALEGKKLLNTLEGFYPERYTPRGFDGRRTVQTRLEFSPSGKGLLVSSALEVCCGGFAGDFPPSLANLDVRLYRTAQNKLLPLPTTLKNLDNTLAGIGTFDGEKLEVFGYDNGNVLYTVGEDAKLERTLNAPEPEFGGISDSRGWKTVLDGRPIYVYRTTQRLNTEQKPSSTALEDFYLIRRNAGLLKLLHLQTTERMNRGVQSDVAFSSNHEFFTLTLEERSSEAQPKPPLSTWPVYAFESRTGKPLEGFPHSLLPEQRPSSVTALSDDGRWILHSGGLFDTRKLKNYALEPQGLKFVQFGGDGKSAWWGNGERLERWSLPL